MTLRNTCRVLLKSSLQCLLDWCKAKRDYFGKMKTYYQDLYDSEKAFQKAAKEHKDAEKAEKRSR